MPLCQWGLGLQEGSLHLQLQVITDSCQLAVGSVWPFLPASLFRGEEWVPLCQLGLGLHEGSLHLQLPSLAVVSWLLAMSGLSFQAHSLPTGEWVALCQWELVLHEGSLHMQLP